MFLKFEVFFTVPFRRNFLFVVAKFTGWGQGEFFGAREWAPSISVLCVCEWHLSRIFPTSCIDPPTCDVRLPFSENVRSLANLLYLEVLIRCCTLRKNPLCYHNILLRHECFLEGLLIFSLQFGSPRCLPRPCFSYFLTFFISSS